MTEKNAHVGDLDAWLADPAVRTRHRSEAGVDAAALWAVAQTIRISDTRILGRLIRWRVPGTSGNQTFREMFTSAPFVLLDEGDQHLFAGVCGKIWSPRPALARLGDSREFGDWSVPGTARVLFAQWVEPTARGAALHSEVRVGPVDRSARLGMRAIWPLISRFEGLIGSEPLRLAARRAEQRAQGSASER